MADIITRENATEGQIHEWSSFASDIGISPNSWAPRTLSTEIGNKQDFVLEIFDGMVARYRQTFGCVTLAVFND